MGSKGRDGSIWRFDIGKRSASTPPLRLRIAELDPPGRDGVAVGPGIWETSGIIDASALFGGEAWLFDVQAHPPTAAPRPNTVEDGQLPAAQARLERDRSTLTSPSRPSSQSRSADSKNRAAVARPGSPSSTSSVNCGSSSSSASTFRGS